MGRLLTIGRLSKISHLPIEMVLLCRSNEKTGECPVLKSLDVTTRKNP